MVQKSSKNLIILFLVAVVLVGAGTFVFLNQGKIKDQGKIKELPEETLSAQEVAEKAIEFISQNLLEEGMTASLVSVEEESGLYKMRLKIGGQEFGSYVTKDGKILFPEEGIDLEQEPESQPQTQEEKSTLGNFKVSEDEICRENEKPLVFFFGSEGCPHCVWEHPVVEEVAKEFEDYISFHNNMDSQADSEIFQKYSTGGIPTIVLGCKYYRVGSGEGSGEEVEKKNLTALICKLTGNEPADVCNPVSDLINQISD